MSRRHLAISLREQAALSSSYARPGVFPVRRPKEARVERTKQKLRDAFSHLLASRPFARITAGEIADRCDVARSTVYRQWAGLGDLLWSIAGPVVQDIFRHALAGSSGSAVQSLDHFWTIPGLLPALFDQSVAETILKNSSAVAAAEIERRSGRRDASIAGLASAGALLTFLQKHPNEPPGREEANEIIFILYSVGLMTPQSLRAAVHDTTARNEGMFPPAVSIRESLADDDYIISMIDGRPYRFLRRHLARYGMSPDDYRRCFRLPQDYPMVSRGYSDVRRSLAKFQGARSRRNRDTHDRP